MPASYQTSTESEPNTHSSRCVTAMATMPSGEPSALAKSSGSIDVPSSSEVIHNNWLSGSLNTKYPSKYCTVTAPGKSGSVIWANTFVDSL